MNSVLWIAGALAFVLALCVSIALHELGHLTVAKKFGLNVPTFMVGFGKKTLFSRTIGGTEYGIRPIPLGGYVKIYDPNFQCVECKDNSCDECIKAQLLSYVSPWKRILVFLAGPAVNIVLGTVMFFLLFLTMNVQAPTNTIEKLSCETQSCPAQEVGLQPQDQILSIEGHSISQGIPRDLVTDLMNKQDSLTMVILRDKQQKTLEVVPQKNDQGQYLIGVQMATEERNLTLGEAGRGTWLIYEQNVKAVLALPSKIPELWRVATGGERSEETPVSVVGATRASGDIASSTTIPVNDKGFRFVALIASFNLGIGLLNLLPLLPLDGGRILIAFLDSAKRRIASWRQQEFKPVGMTVMNAFAAVVLVLILFYMGLAIVADIVSPVSIE